MLIVFARRCWAEGHRVPQRFVLRCLPRHGSHGLRRDSTRSPDGEDADSWCDRQGRPRRSALGSVSLMEHEKISEQLRIFFATDFEEMAKSKAAAAADPDNEKMKSNRIACEALDHSLQALGLPLACFRAGPGVGTLLRGERRYELAQDEFPRAPRSLAMAPRRHDRPRPRRWNKLVPKIAGRPEALQEGPQRRHLHQLPNQREKRGTAPSRHDRPRTAPRRSSACRYPRHLRIPPPPRQGPRARASGPRRVPQENPPENLRRQALAVRMCRLSKASEVHVVAVGQASRQLVAQNDK